MVNKIKIFILMVSLAISAIVRAQELSYTDSLKYQLKKCETVTDSVDILCKLTWALADNNSEEIFKYGPLALEKASKISDSVLIANAYDAAALSYRISGDTKRSKEYYQVSLDIGLRNNIVERIAWSGYHLENIALTQGDISQAKKYANNSYENFMRVGDYRRAFDCYWVLIKSGHLYYSDTLSRLIINYLPLIKDESNKIFLYIDLTNLYNLGGDRNKAMHYVQLAMELAEKQQNTKGIVKAYNQIAAYFRNIQHNYSMALIYYEKILELYQLQKIENKGDIYTQIGDIQRLMGNDSLALNYFNKALEEGKRYKHRHTMASAFMKLGDLNYNRKFYNDAQFYYVKCYETNCDVCPKIKFHDALINLGNVYLFSGDMKNAQLYYQKSLEIADSASDLRAQSNSWQAFATLFEKQGNLPKAIEYNQKALIFAKNAQYIEGQQIDAEKLSVLYLRLKNYQKAFEYTELANLLKDSINKTNEIDNLAKLETYFDFKNLQMQRELDSTRANEEINRQKIFRNLFVVGFILIGLSGFLIFIGYRRKKKANTMLYEQKVAIEMMSKKVHDADQAKLQFFTNISHEFKTPLTLILGMTEKMKTIVNENNSIILIRKNAYKLLQLVNHLLDLRKIDTSSMSLKVKEGNLSVFLKGIISSFENLVRQKNISLDFRSSEDTFMAWFDPDMMEKIFSNLLSNAIKYSNIDGIIKVVLAQRNDGFVTINVSDNGIGIAENEANNIFERFYRVAGNSHPGSGIGLALVKELVELHKGEINVNCKKNMGSSFTVILPFEKSFYKEKEIADFEEFTDSWNYVDVVDIEDNIPEEIDNSGPNPNSKSILVAEDNGDLRKFIADIFIEEYAVIEAMDGAEAFRKSCEYVPDIIISDIMMPNVSGIQLVDKLKNNTATSHIPIILLTAKNDIATHLNSFEKGVDDFISKPFDTIILKSRVENILRLRKQLVEKFSQQFKLQPREITIENADQKFLQKAIDIIEKNMSNPNLNVELLAFELGVSRTQLYRKLNALIDFPPKHFIRIIRLKRAAQILQQGQNNIAEVMDATGFSNYSFFNNCFKDFFGKFPKDYAIVNVKGSLN